jgi:hypothetical protein
MADYRTKAGECCRMAALAPRPADRATWLKLAYEWLAVKQPATERLDVVLGKHDIPTICSCDCQQTARGETTHGETAQLASATCRQGGS